jgi:putative hydrolase
MRDFFYQNINFPLNHKKVPLVDMHMHTNWTDGENTSKEMIKISNKKKLKYIFFSEHSRKHSGQWFNQFADEIDIQKKKSRCKIFVGTEVKVLNFDGELDINSEIQNRSDFVMSSVHRFPGEKSDIKKLSKIYSNEEAIKIEYNLTMSAIENPRSLIIGHPFGMSIKRFGIIPDKRFFIDIIKKCKKFDKVFEINSRYHPNLDFLVKTCLKHDVLLSLGSNAHNVEQVGHITKLMKLYFEKN